MNKLLLPLFLLISGFVFGQGTPCPNYQQFGSATTRTAILGLAQGQKGVTVGRYTDTATANSSGCADYYAGTLIITDSPLDVLWQRNSTATKWISRGSGGIDSITFITDSSIIICFASGSCDTVPINNFTTIVNNIVQNFIDTTIINNGGDVFILNDSLLVICNGENVCDTINFGDDINNFYFLNDSTIVVCDTPQVICVADSCYTQQICDTISVPRRIMIRLQNGVQFISPGVGEHGNPTPDPNPSQLQKDTYLYTDFYNYGVSGAPYLRPVMSVQNKQWTQISPSIMSFNSLGGNPFQFPEVDNNNPVNLYLNYMNRFIEGSGVFAGDTIGTMYDRIGYSFMTNASGTRAGYDLQSQVAKQSGIMFHTFDTQYTDAVTIFGNQVPNRYLFSVSPFPTTTLLDSRIAVFKTDGVIQFNAYPNSRDDGASPDGKGFYADTDGNLLYGEIGGGGGGTLVDANNGLSIFQDSIVQLFGPVATPSVLLNDRHLNQVTFSLYHAGTASGYMVDVQNSNGSGSGIYGLGETVGVGGQTNNGIGIYGVSTGGYGVYGTTANGGTGVSGVSTNGTTVGLGGFFEANDNTTNNVIPIVQIRRNNSSTPAAGIGASFDFLIRTASGSSQTANQIISKWTTATHASRVSQFIITGVNAAVTADLFTLSGSGETRLNKYGVGSFTAGTAVYLAAYKSDGTLMEYPPGGVSSGLLISADNGLSVRSATTAVLGQNVGEVGNPAILLSSREIPMGGFTLALNAGATQAVNIFQTTNAAAAVRARITSGGEFSNNNGAIGSEQFGEGALASGNNSTAFGYGAVAAGQSNIAIGNGAVTHSSNDNITIGTFSSGVSSGTTILGVNTDATSGGRHTLIGASIQSSSSSSVGVGYGIVLAGGNNIAIGEQANAGHSYSQAYGFGATTTAGSQLVYGASNSLFGGINDAYYGRGVTSTVANDFKMQPTGASGTNMAGNLFTIAGSKGTGNAAQGSIMFQTSVLEASGTTLQSLADRMIVHGTGVVGIGKFSSFTATRLEIVDNAVAGAPIVSITSTSTAAASDLQKGINIEISGANSNANQDTYGVYSVNTHTGSNASNIGIFANASGGTTNFGVVGRVSASGTSAGVFADNQSSGYGLWASSTGGTAVNAQTTSTGTTIVATAEDGIAVRASSTTNAGGVFSTDAEAGSSLGAIKNVASTNTAIALFDINRNTTATTAAGIGAKIRFLIEDLSFPDELANEIVSTLTNVTHANKTSTLNFTGQLNNTTVDLLTLAGNGTVKLRPITATAASAITPAEGMLVFVSDTDATFTTIGIWCYQNGAWKAL